MSNELPPKHLAPTYGSGDTSFHAAGGEQGIRQLIDDFYAAMESDSRFARINAMHPPNRAVTRDKLARFICGWLGGPKLYNQAYGRISIPAAHEHLDITQVEHDQWLTCMAAAIARQPFDTAFADYLLEQLAVPASAILKRCMTG